MKVKNLRMTLETSVCGDALSLLCRSQKATILVKPDLSKEKFIEVGEVTLLKISRDWLDLMVDREAKKTDDVLDDEEQALSKVCDDLGLDSFSKLFVQQLRSSESDIETEVGDWSEIVYIKNCNIKPELQELEKSILCLVLTQNMGDTVGCHPYCLSEQKQSDDIKEYWEDCGFEYYDSVDQLLLTPAWEPPEWFAAELLQVDILEKVGKT